MRIRRQDPEETAKLALETLRLKPNAVSADELRALGIALGLGEPRQRQKPRARAQASPLDTAQLRTRSLWITLAWSYLAAKQRANALYRIGFACEGSTGVEFSAF